MTERNLPEDWLQRLADGALSGPELAEAEARLAADPALARQADALRAENAAIRAAVPQPEPDRLAGLAANVKLRATQRSEAWRIAAMAALFAVGVGAGWLGATGTQNRRMADLRSGVEALVAAADAAHRLYSVEVLHPVEVGAAERSHLNAWLSNRLGGSIAAPDLSGTGFRLVGGRLLPGLEGAAAQFMYEDASGGRITLYVVPGSGAARAPRFETASDGLITVAWEDETWRFALVGELPRASIEALARRMQGAMI